MLSMDDSSSDSIEQASEVLQALVELDTGGFNTIPEVFDGEAPHRPNGCISQAWSVAEVIRAWALVKEKKI